MANEEMRIGPYRIEGSLGVGGMGVVYRAVHVDSKRVAALKTVRLPSPQWLAGIRREILALTRLRHPGVVRILAQGVHEGRPWYAMELLEGEVLRSVIRRRFGDLSRRRMRTTFENDDRHETAETVTAEVHVMSAVPGAQSVSRAISSRREPTLVSRPADRDYRRDILGIMSRLCSTLAYLHGEGIVNGDLKPENVLLTADRSPVIIDFGLTSTFGGSIGREALESSRGLAGTLPYIAPEEIRNEFVDARADLYAVGCILYEVLTGTTPFVGTPTEILDQHLHNRPLPPTELVKDIPREVESLIMGLLEKQLSDRVGYAEDVALALRSFTSDTSPIPAPASRPYLYRPRFSGRTDRMQPVLADLEDVSTHRHGRLILVGGESGVGKTRFAMEVTRMARERAMRVITAQCAQVSSAQAGAVASVPLSALKPLLQAIADHCQNGGRQLADRVLGGRGPVLALYEPSLSHAPGQDQHAVPRPLSSGASRRRLFGCLSATLTAFAKDLPLLVVIDDLQWADELTLAFLRSLTTDFWDATPLVILASYRHEETTEEIRALLQSPQVHRVTLDRLGEDSVREIVRDLLASSSLPPDGLVRFLVRQSKGNPFVVIEYLRAAVAAGLLQRRPFEPWRINPAGQSSEAAYDSLPLPGALQDLIQNRLTNLPADTRSVLDFAAVIGRRVDEALLLASSGDQIQRSIREIIDELTSRQILEYGEEGDLTFVHDKIREVVYGLIPQKALAELHRRAALAIIDYRQNDTDFSAVWPSLGNHFALAGVCDRAFDYLVRAGDHARARSANEEAITLYRAALAQLDRFLLTFDGDAVAWKDSGARVRESLADLLALAGRRDEARTNYEIALDRLASGSRLARARLLRKFGKTLENELRHADALRYYQMARETLGAWPTSGAADEGSWQDEWVLLRSDQAFTNYWLAAVPAMEEQVQELMQVLGTRATSRQRVHLHRAQMLLCFLRDRYVIGIDGVEHARAGLNECLASGDLEGLPMAHFTFAFALFVHQDFEAADWELRSALGVADRAGDVAQQARCLTYLSINARRRNRLVEARGHVTRSLSVAKAVGMPDYLGAAHANSAWLAYREGDLVAAEQHANTALSTWRSVTYVYPFQWTALFPLLHLKLVQDDIVEAGQLARSLIEPRQQQLPAPLVEDIVRARTLLECSDVEQARGAFRSIVSSAVGHHFL